MEQLLVEIAKQVPALAVLVVLVLRFLRAQKEQGDSFVAALTARDAANAVLVAGYNETQRETNQVLGQAKEALDSICEDSSKTRGVLHRTEQALTANTAALQAASNRG